MSEIILTFLPTGREIDKYVVERNRALAAYLAKITDRVFGGDLEEVRVLTDREYLFPYRTLSKEEGARFGIISPDQLFGAVIEPIYAEKSIFHVPLDNPISVPTNFPHEFANSLINQEVVIPGFTAFTHDDILTAYETLTEQGYVVRAKHPIGDSGAKQLVVNSREDLTRYIDREEEWLSGYGIILEANLIKLKTLMLK